MDAFHEPLGRDFLCDAVGGHPVGQRSGAAQRLVDFAVRLAVGLLVALADVHVEIGLDLVDEPDRPSRELAAGAGQGPQMRADVGSPLL